MDEKKSAGLLMAIAGAGCLAIATVMLVGPVLSGQSTSRVYTGIVKGVAVGGYDAVAYFTAGKPVPGSPEITTVHDGATWRFGSEAHRAAFIASPETYSPQFGGHCAWAVSQGYAAKGDPNAWKIINGKLYLNYDLDVQRTWEKESHRNIELADANWPKLLAK